ncbi:MAG: glycosyltransferase family 39 protein [Patescibacteria group bacterium]|nr:glycosyltransferase family 39 protein [Patescibacteria group bacterium]
MNTFFETHRKTVVLILLLGGFALSLFTMLGDSAIVDEIAHVPAGYSYVRYGDYRLNPEHPPLIKDLAGLPLLLLPLSFPTDIPAWTTDTNGQWETGWNFIYHYGNNADLILFFARLPILLLYVLFGWLLYVFIRKYFGTNTALLSVFFYALSPNFLAHNHLVTTDLGIAFFIFLALATFGAFLVRPSWKTLGLTTLALAGAELAKFSAVLLIPFYAFILLLALIFIKAPPKFELWGSYKIKRAFWKKLYVYGLSYFLMMAGALVLIWLYYIPHVWNFPADKQIELIKTSLPDPRWGWLTNFLTAIAPNKILSALTQYLLGVAMVFGRVGGGNTTYFLGQVSNQSFKWYFPVSYLLKEQVPFLLLLSLTLVLSVAKLWRTKIKNYFSAFSRLLAKEPLKPIFFLFILYYAGISISGNLNLGIRHLFPILPLIYILVADQAAHFFANFKTFWGKPIGWSILGLLIFWYALTPLVVFPNYLSYHNEIIGGGKYAYRYFTDSNVDWGQDLKRLVTWTKEHPEITTLKLDYFGGGEPRYYFCNRKYDEQGHLIKSAAGYDCSKSIYREYHVNDGPTTGWIAVSVTFLQNAKWYAIHNGQPDYEWLRSRTPYAKIGNSIFVYWVR